MESPQNYEDLVRRAELFNYIAGLVKDLPPPHPGALILHLSEREARPKSPASAAASAQGGLELLPRVTTIDRRVFCNGASLDLSNRPMMLRLFKTFCCAAHLQIDRDDLVREVYRIANPATRPARYIESLVANGIKLMSRARIAANMYLSHGFGHGLEWFVYDQERKVWCLYRLRTQYLADRFGS